MYSKNTEKWDILRIQIQLNVAYLVHLLQPHPTGLCAACVNTQMWINTLNLTCVYPIRCHYGGKTRHRLSGEVPHCMQHISGMNPVVVWEKKTKLIYPRNILNKYHYCISNPKMAMVICICFMCFLNVAQ